MNTPGLQTRVLALVPCLCALALWLSATQSAQAQIVLSTQATQLTLEGFANFSAGDAGRFAGASGDDARLWLPTDKD